MISITIRGSNSEDFNPATPKTFYVLGITPNQDRLNPPTEWNGGYLRHEKGSRRTYAVKAFPFTVLPKASSGGLQDFEDLEDLQDVLTHYTYLQLYAVSGAGRGGDSGAFWGLHPLPASIVVTDHPPAVTNFDGTIDFDFALAATLPVFS